MSSLKIIDLRARKARLFYRQPVPPNTRVPLRKRKRRIRFIALTILLIGVGACAYGLHYVSYMERFSINKIEVHGAETIDPSLIRQYVEHVINDDSRHYLSRGNVFLYPKKVIQKDLEIDFPRIKSANVSRPSLFSKTLVVVIQERAYFARWCYDPKECFQMDDGGFIFAEAASENPAKYVFSGGVAAASTSPIGQVFVPTHVPALIALLSRLETAGFIPEGARVENEKDFQVPLKDSFVIKASFGSDADTVVKNLQLILSNPPLQGNQSKLEYVDLRFGNRVYYKMSAQGGSASDGEGEISVPNVAH